MRMTLALRKIKTALLCQVGLFLLFAFLFLSKNIFAEASGNPTMANSPEAIRVQRFKQAARAKLISKLSNPDGSSSKIYILAPMNYTSLKNPEVINEIIKKSIEAYDDNIKIKNSGYALSALTLEAFRMAMVHLKAEIVVATVLNPTSFDIYLYDKRTPYQIYAHNEPISGTARYDFTPEAAAYFTKLLIRRTLYRYIKNQYYELPRDDSPTVLKSEIPRFIASTESLAIVNREAHTSLYAAVHLGAALSYGATKHFWNSNLFVFQAGLRIYDKVYLEGAFDMFAYNGAVASLKYIFSNRASSFKVGLGAGLGYLFPARYTLNWDQTNGDLQKTYYAVPSISVMLPIVDVYLKAESQIFMALTGQRRYIVTIMPGLLVMF